MGFQFPNTPALNDTYTPVGGPVFTWDGVAWKGTSQGAPVTVYVSDTAPLSPAIGQLWWNSATGTMAIWYADSDSAQWVQVSGQVLPTAPSDNGEYVMVNGVWRLVRQSFNLAGLSQQDLTVPAWGPTQARLSSTHFSTTTSLTYLRMSIDGTTFASGASDYFTGGVILNTGSGGFQINAMANVPQLYLLGSSDYPTVPRIVEAVINLTRNPGLLGYHSHGTYANGAATVLAATMMFQGYANAATFAGTGPLKALRWFVSAGVVSSGVLSVDWLA